MGERCGVFQGGLVSLGVWDAKGLFDVNSGRAGVGIIDDLDDTDRALVSDNAL